MKIYSSDYIFPEYVLDGIKNENLKIIVDITDDSTYSFMRSGFCVTRGERIGIVKDNSINIITVRNTNLLRILQDHKIPGDDLLPGTYKLMKLDDYEEIYDIIPEFSYEGTIKTKFSDRFHNKKLPFTKKMIPGHIYASKYRGIFICIGSDLDYYSKEIDNYAGLYYRLCNYSSIPKKVKILARINIKEDRKYKTIQEFAISKLNNSCIIYSDSYAGKDLGPYLKDDGRPFEDYIIGCPKLTTYWFFINELYKHEPSFHDKLREDLFCVNHKDEILKYNPETKIIYDI